MKDIKSIIAGNITDLRKHSKITQAELAEKLNYSDKAISKWERGESIPDVTVLMKLADFFGVTLDYLTHEDHPRKSEQALKRHNKRFVTAMSVVVVFLVLIIGFVVSTYAFPQFASWLLLIYALPLALAVWLILGSVWFPTKKLFLIISGLMWAVILSVYLSLFVLCENSVWELFLIGIPGQLIILFWSRIKRHL